MLAPVPIGGRSSTREDRGKDHDRKHRNDA